MKKRIIALLLAAFLILCAMPTSFAADEKADVPDVSGVRGVNYEFEGKTEERWRSDLAIGKRVNLNSVRIWLSFDSYVSSSETYISRIKRFFTVCQEMGYTVMPILFNGNSIDASNPYQLDESFYPRGEKYVKDMVDAFAADPAFFMFDIMNEPTCNHLFWDAKTAEEKASWSDKTWKFVKYFCKYVKQISPDSLITVGNTYQTDINKTAEVVDVISYHDYASTTSTYISNANSALRAAAYYKKPVMNTETGCTGRGNPYDVVFQILAEKEIPFYFYGLTADGYWSDIHGIFYADGTVRDPAAVAALLGFYRNRDYTTIVSSNANREQYVTNCLEKFENLLKGNSDSFNHQSISVKSLLNICDEMANLLEANQLVAMDVPPSAKVNYYRSLENPNLQEVLDFAYDMAQMLKEACHLL